jgi:hypothetical protein
MDDVDLQYRRTMDELAAQKRAERDKAKAEAQAEAEEFAEWASQTMRDPPTKAQKVATWMRGWPLARLPKTIPSGLYLVHMSKGPPKRGFNLRSGNMTWFQLNLTDTSIEPCSCGWAPHLGCHYRSMRKP